MAVGAARGIRGGVPRRSAAVERELPDFSACQRIDAKPLWDEREEGAGQRRDAQSNPKAHPGNSAITSRGDSTGMGRGDTSELVRGNARVYETRDGVAGAAAAREASSEVTRKNAAHRGFRWLALACVRGYQIFLGPFFGGSCKFEPSCSHYTYEAVERFGARRGAWLGLKRFLRCRPFSAGGYDPVPEISPENGPNRQAAAKTAEVAN